MENVKFVRIEENGGMTHMFFKICDNLADFLRANTSYSENELNRYLDKDNTFRYIIHAGEEFKSIQKSVVDTIEKISNERDDAYFYNHVLTNNGRHKSPPEVHNLMRTEYGLADIDETEIDGNEEREDTNIEWWTAHFFTALAGLLFDEPIEEFEDGDCSVLNL